jgi:hypothetical protein
MFALPESWIYFSSGNRNLDARSHARQFRHANRGASGARFLEDLGVNGIHAWEQVYVR